MSLNSSVWQPNLQWRRRTWKILVSRKLLLRGLQLKTVWRRETPRSSTMMFLQRLDLEHWTVIAVSGSVQRRHTVAASSSLIVLFLRWFLLIAKDVEDVYEDIQPVSEQRANGWSSNEFESFDDLSDDDAAPAACSQVSPWSEVSRRFSWVWRRTLTASHPGVSVLEVAAVPAH